MLTLQINGSFEGYEESKSHPGKFFVYVKPLSAPPAGFLRSMKCPKDFGAPADGIQRLGCFAVLCEESSVPTLAVGDKIALSASCWPISRPIWSDREANIVHTREISPLYVLDGEIKTTNAKATPATFTVRGYYQGAVRIEGGQIKVRCVIEDVPPSWLLRQVRVEKNKGRNNYVIGEEILGCFSLIADAGHVPVIPANASIEAKGVCWPVCDPYWSKEMDSVVHPKVPDPVFLTTANIATEKVKAA